MKNLSTLLTLTGLVAAGLSLAPRALAHTETFGYTVNSPGDLTFWEGTYDHGYDINEGTLTITSINGNPFGTETLAFDLLSGSAPVGETILQSDISIGLADWQGVEFTGLTAGDYSYTMSTDNDGLPEWEGGTFVNDSGTFTLSAADGASAPDGASTVALLGGVLVGVGALRRKFGRS